MVYVFYHKLYRLFYLALKTVFDTKKCFIFYITQIVSVVLAGTKTDYRLTLKTVF
jgi:hypothetical protein